MAQPSSAQTIVPVTQVCKTFSANRPCALFIRVPPECTLNAPCLLSAPCNVAGVLFHNLHLARSKNGTRDSSSQGVVLPANVSHYLIDGGHCAAMQRWFAAIQGPFWTQRENVAVF